MKEHLRILFLFLAVLVWVFSCTTPQSSPSASAEFDSLSEGRMFPGSVRIANYAAGQINTDSLKGRVTVINFWATWCASCKVEIKEMETKFFPLIKNKEFQVAFVSLDKNPEQAKEWFMGNLTQPKEYIKYLYKDPDFAAANELKVDAFPTTIIVGKDGKIAFVQRGYEEGVPSTDKIVNLSLNLLK